MELKQRVDLINKIHLFNGLKEDELADIAVKFEERYYKANETVFNFNDKPDGFYIVTDGKVNILRPDKKDKTKDPPYIWLVHGDYFGEEALVENRARSATIIAYENTKVLFMSRANFESLLGKHPKLKPNFLVAIKSHKIARATKFKWLGPKEMIYFIARRHKIRLYMALVAPVLSLILPVGLFFSGLLVDAITTKIIGGLSLLAIFGWIIWNVIDWGNDYYIVTNQRVIWLEKVIGLYDSREEAPLQSLLSVNVETSQLGRMLDFGNVIVRTFVGKIEFDYVDHPNQAADMIREYWERVKSVTTVSQKDLMKNTIRQKLNLPVAKKTLEELPPVVFADKKMAQQSLWWLAFKNLFNLRIEDGGTVIYHKHWVVLFQQTWKPLLFLLCIIALQIWRGIFLFQSSTKSFLYTNATDSLRIDTISLVISVLGLLVFIIWFGYQYWDWSNDIFKLTADEIFDIDRTPFGKEERKVAQIENILSISYTRKGPIEHLFDYGTVNIMVGGAKFDFQDVAEPANVQADINRRRLDRILKKKENAGKEDRERFATWIAAYHENIEDFKTPVIKPAEYPIGQSIPIGNNDDAPLMGTDDDNTDSEKDQSPHGNEWN